MSQEAQQKDGDRVTRQLPKTKPAMPVNGSDRAFLTVAFRERGDEGMSCVIQARRVRRQGR